MAVSSLKHMLAVCWLVLCMGLPERLFALDLAPGQGSVALGRVVEILRDPTGKMSLEEVRQRPAREFFRVDKEVPSFGFDSATYWARFSVRNSGSETERWMLEYAYAPAMWVSVHAAAADDVTLTMLAGTRVPVTERPWRHHYHVFPLELKPGLEYQVYIRVAGETSKNFPISLTPLEQFVEDAQADFLLFGAIFGIGIGFVLYNALIWHTVREDAYLYYVLFTSCVGLVIATLTGFLQLVVMPQSTFLAPSLLPVAMHLTMTTGFKSLRAFLGDQTLGPQIVTCLRYIGYGSLALSPLVFLVDYLHAIRIATALVAITPFVAAILLFRQARRGSRFALYYLAAWGVLLLGAVFTALRTFGVIPSNTLTEHSVYVGWSVMSVLMSLGLAARMRELKDENTAAISQLVRNEKLASIGMMSAGVAHEINNPNNVIRLSIQQLTVKLAEAREFLLGLLEDDDADMRGEISTRFDAMRQQAGLVAQGSERIADIVSSMRSSSRKDPGEAVVFDPVQGVLDTLTLVKVNWAKKVEFVNELITGAQVKGHPSELKQVFMNLLVNACQAIEDRQKSSRGHPGEVILISTVIGNELHLVFQDNGCGMSESVRQRLFQPFFTTKGEERGTGLGVSICRRIVETHGGRLEVHSIEGEGSVFTVVLPVLAPVV